MITDPKKNDDRVMSLAAEALETPLSKRESFLQTACGNDPDLYNEVSEVMIWEERMRGFLHRPLIDFIDLEALGKVFEPRQRVAGRFEIVRFVGDGGMGVVYEAFDHKRKERIAIKCAKPGYGRLLLPELKGALKVRHPNICMVNEIHAASSEFGELDFLTMEFLDGETIAARLARCKLDEAEAFEIARQLCAGVAAAHRSGVLHRDLKPGNVILCPSKDGRTRAVITDFGLATESSVGGEAAGGTPTYMAPELSRGGKTSQASDIFSLGVILYEMATGQKPFPPNAEAGGALHHVTDPNKLVKDLPHRWEKAIRPCLKSRPEERPSAEDVLAALEHKPFFQRPAVVVALAACLILVIGIAAPKIIDHFKPAPIRLAVLPVECPIGLEKRGQEILNDVAARVGQMQAGKAKVSVIPLSTALRKNVGTAQQALDGLEATHALQLKLRPEGDGLTAEAAIIDLRTMAHVRDYSGQFAGQDLTDLPGGLAGSVAFGLHIQRMAKLETVLPVAAAAYQTGLNYLEREPPDYLDAAREFQQAARLDPHSPLTLAGLAEASGREFRATGNKQTLDEAKRWLAKAEMLDADSPKVRLSSGFLHQIQGEPAKALVDYQRVEEVEPQNAEGWLGSGLAYELQGLADKALTDYVRAIAKEPNNYKPYEYLGRFYYSHGDYAAAEEQYKNAVARPGPNPLGAYGSLAGLYATEFNYVEAERVFRESLRLEETPLTLNNIGVMLAFQARDSEAIQYYQRAIQRNGNRYIYWLNLGDAQRRLGQPASAKSYRKGLSLAQKQVDSNPSSASSRAYLAYLHARLGLKSRARSEVAQALHSPAKDAQVVRCAVETYEALGDRTLALEAAGVATAQTLKELDHHPDMADLRRDSRFRSLMGKNN